MPTVYNIRDPDCPITAVYIGRGSVCGNPFKIGRDGNRAEVCQKFKDWLETVPYLKQKMIIYCQGKDLKCFCKPLECHGDHLLAISNK